MKIKSLRDHKIIHSATCGEIREILGNGDFSGLDLAIAINIQPTKAHFHLNFEEIYFVLDGSITLETFEPDSGVKTEHVLFANELCVIPRETHHKILSSSETNRLCVISVPEWSRADEYPSDVL